MSESIDLGLPGLNSISSLLFQKNDAVAAENACRLFLNDHPAHPVATHLLGLALCQDESRVLEGIALLEQSIASAPETAEFHRNLGGVWGRLGKYDRAAVELLKAVTLLPNEAAGHLGLSAALGQLGDLPASEASARRAVALDPSSAPAHHALGSILARRGENGKAIASFSQALTLWPEFPEAWSNLARTYETMGLGPEALHCYRQGVRIRPTDAKLHSNLLFAMRHTPQIDDEAMYAEHGHWAHCHAERLYPKAYDTFSNPRSSDRKLRIGYISADFCTHSVASFLEPLITSHNQEAFEVFCYSDVLIPDQVTDRIRSVASVWRECRGIPDPVLAQWIRDDQIDVLVDPTGHMGNNRLLVFARKPAPVQIAYNGYPGTTGLKTIDYFVTDEAQHPPGSLDVERFTERLLYLSTSRCYRSPDSTISPGKLPADRVGHITFGSLNRPAKLTPAMMKLWGEILLAVKDSKLLLVVGTMREEEASRHYAPFFEKMGILKDRLQFATQRRLDDYLALFNRVDVALDCFPYNGCTTVCDALWMGVPTITLSGKTFVSRVALSILSQIGLSDLATYSEPDYIQKALSLANDRPRLQSLRGTLRDQMLRSRLCDARGFILEFESAVRESWRERCSKNPAISEQL
jgi:protein O-GlcNAc transferase